MASLYIVVDQFGLIAGFNNIDRAYTLIESYPKVKLMVIEFPMDREMQKEEFYFLPYVGNNAIALASNNKKYILNIKTQLLSIGMTYPDSLQFYTRTINKVHELEMRRLISPDFNPEDPMKDMNNVTEKLTNLTMLGGMFHEQYNILDEEYGLVVSSDSTAKTTPQDKQQLLPEDNVCTTQAETQN
mgnify:CR=1 FL=1